MNFVNIAVYSGILIKYVSISFDHCHFLTLRFQKLPCPIFVCPALCSVDTKAKAKGKFALQHCACNR